MREIDNAITTLRNPAYKKTEVSRVLVNSFNAKLATTETENIFADIRKANEKVTTVLNNIWEERANPKTGEKEFYLRVTPCAK